MAFYKFLDENAIESFLSGNMLFKCIEYYRGLEEDEIGRSDKHDGELASKAWETPYGNPIEVILTPNRKEDHVMCVSRNLAKQNLDRMSKFGNKVIVIEDEEAFTERIRKRADIDKYEFACQNAFYYSGEEATDISIMKRLSKGLEQFSFLKRKLFHYQQEFRFLVFRENASQDDIWLKIGNIEDIAEVMSPEELKKRLV